MAALVSLAKQLDKDFKEACEVNLLELKDSKDIIRLVKEGDSLKALVKYILNREDKFKNL